MTGHHYREFDVPLCEFSLCASHTREPVLAEFSFSKLMTWSMEYSICVCCVRLFCPFGVVEVTEEVLLSDLIEFKDLIEKLCKCHGEGGTLSGHESRLTLQLEREGRHVAVDCEIGSTKGDWMRHRQRIGHKSNCLFSTTLAFYTTVDDLQDTLSQLTHVCDTFSSFL